MIPWLRGPHEALPDTRLALSPDSDAPGLLAAGGDLSAERLEEAYLHGIFPWFSEGQPILWWSPDPRMTLFVDEFKLSRSLRKTLTRFARSGDCEVRIDSNFRGVIGACASAPREGQVGTWIVPEMIDAYTAWHEQGRVHSFETWVGGDLVGGLYGVNLGRIFFGESMFSNRTDASKIALAALVCFCREHRMPMVDCQQRTSHLSSLGGRELSRDEFEARCRSHLGQAPPKEWNYHPNLWRHLGIGGGAEDLDP